MIVSCYYLVKKELMPLKQIHDFSTQLSVQHSVGTTGPLQLARRPLLFRLWLHTEQWCQLFSFAIILWSYFFDSELLETWHCAATTASCAAFFPRQRAALKLLFAVGQESVGKFGGKDGYFFWVVFILRLWWKTIICVPWAIFPRWPASERSVFDMPVVLEEKGRTAGVWVLFSI